MNPTSFSSNSLFVHSLVYQITHYFGQTTVLCSYVLRNHGHGLSNGENRKSV